jgi:transposase, IS30 family
MVQSALSEAEKAEIWRRYRTGASLRAIHQALGRAGRTVWSFVASTGGMPPAERTRSPLRLSLSEREEISRGLVAHESCRAIARRLGRAASTVSREVAGHGGRERYRACDADRAAWQRARRPKPAKLATHPDLGALVATKLKLCWSPQQIAGWLRRAHGDDPELQVSHETIYQSLFVQSRGALKRELTAYLRMRRTLRRPRGTNPYSHGSGKLRDPINIRERPAEAADRAVPGHWEGDLLLGSGNSAIVTLVERSSRFVILIRLPNGRSSEAVLAALKRRVVTLPQQLMRSLTWDQGKEMAEHARFTVETGLQIYFCDPQSPWQRGSNENTNGLLRQYFPKFTSLAHVNQRRLDAVAAELNGRPRQTLGFMSPSEKFAEAVAMTA